MLFPKSILFVVSIACLATALLWGKAAKRLYRALNRMKQGIHQANDEVLFLAQSNFEKDLHTTVLYLIFGLAALVTSVIPVVSLELPFLAVFVPIVYSFKNGTKFLNAAKITEQRSSIEKRAEEVLAQDELAPMQWSARLAPEDLPFFKEIEVGRVYQPDTGTLGGDFYDLYQTSPTRLAIVIGDVTGHGVDPSITAFQAKYLLRIFLRQYRDPAQALEELNLAISDQTQNEELISMWVGVFDSEAETLRFASAGHPAGWFWHDGEVVGLESTGPLLTLDPKGRYTSLEVETAPGDVLLLYTDGLSEARSGDSFYGEERIASFLRKDPGKDMQSLAEELLENAIDFASKPLDDDVAILAIRRV